MIPERSASDRKIAPAGDRATRSLLFSTLLMMAGLLLSKVTGQLREILIQPIFGIGEISDAYIIGFQIPDLFFQLLVGGAIQAVITPTLAAAIERGQEKKAWRSISILINLTGVLMLVAVVVGVLTAPFLIPLINSGKSPETQQLAVRVTQALFPQVFFMMMAALCIGILNAYKRFSSTSFGPTVYNICVIIAMAALGSATASGAVHVATGVMIAALIYFVLQFFLARREFQHYVFSFDYHDSGFVRLLHRAVPTLLSGSIVQINTIILTGFANQFAGAATMLRQATTTWQLPYGIFAVAIGNVMLPSLSRQFAAGEDTGARRLLTQSLRRALFLVIPAATLFFVMPQDTISAIFQWSRSYTDSYATVTASILRFYCIAMIAQTFVFLTNQAFYSRGQTRITLLNGVFTLILNVGFCFILTRFTDLGVSSLSLAYALTSCFSALFLMRMYRLSRPSAVPRGLTAFLVRSLVCSLSMAILVLAMGVLPIDPTGKIARLAWYGLRCLLGLGVYMLTAVALAMPEPLQVLGRIKDRIKLSRK